MPTQSTKTPKRIIEIKNKKHKRDRMDRIAEKVQDGT